MRAKTPKKVITIVYIMTAQNIFMKKKMRREMKDKKKGENTYKQTIIQIKSQNVQVKKKKQEMEKL